MCFQPLGVGLPPNRPPCGFYPTKGVFRGPFKEGAPVCPPRRPAGRLGRKTRGPFRHTPGEKPWLVPPGPGPDGVSPTTKLGFGFPKSGFLSGDRAKEGARPPHSQIGHSCQRPSRPRTAKQGDALRLGPPRSISLFFLLLP